MLLYVTKITVPASETLLIAPRHKVNHQDNPIVKTLSSVASVVAHAVPPVGELHFVPSLKDP